MGTADDEGTERRGADRRDEDRFGHGRELRDLNADAAESFEGTGRGYPLQA
ncbi:hypothetical protein D3C76_1832710 [compost metagenome]